MNTTGLILNCFPVELSQTTFDVPFLDYATWEVSTRALKEDYCDYLAYRYKTDDQQIRVVFLNGPRIPGGLEIMTVDVAQFPHFGQKVIERSVARYLTAKGLIIRRTGFETMAMRKSPEFSLGSISVFSGISFQPRRPFAKEPHRFMISVKWEVSASFNQSLIDLTLRAIAIGMPVLYKPVAATRNIPPDLRRFRNRYLGRVREIRSDTEAVIYCKDDALRRMPLADLFLEASPEAIRAYERESGLKHEARSVWQKIQELDFVLTAARRRNPSVLRERLQAIRRFLGGDAREQLILPLSYFRGGSISIGLSPVRVEVQ